MHHFHGDKCVTATQIANSWREKKKKYCKKIFVPLCLLIYTKVNTKWNCLWQNKTALGKMMSCESWKGRRKTQERRSTWALALSGCLFNDIIEFGFSIVIESHLNNFWLSFDRFCFCFCFYWNSILYVVVKQPNGPLWFLKGFDRSEREGWRTWKDEDGKLVWHNYGSSRTTQCAWILFKQFYNTVSKTVSYIHTQHCCHLVVYPMKL